MGPHPVLRHDALLYDSEAALTAALVPFVDEARRAGEPVIAAVSEATREALAATLPSTTSVAYLDAHTWYREPEHTIAGYREELGRLLGGGARGVRVIGEIAFGATPAEQRAWARYESRLNTVFAPWPAWIVCPYDTRRLPAEVVAEAARTHPHLLGAERRWRSEDYVPAADYHPALGADGAGLGVLAEVTFDADLAELRRLVRLAAEAEELEAERAESFVLAAHELATNAMVHGRPPNRLRICREGDWLACEIVDAGGRVPARSPQPPDSLPERGMGLLIAEQLADELELSASAGQTVARVRMHRRDAASRAPV